MNKVFELFGMRFEKEADFGHYYGMMDNPVRYRERYFVRTHSKMWPVWDIKIIKDDEVDITHQFQWEALLDGIYV